MVPAVPDLWVADLAGHMGQDRSRGSDLGAVGDVVVTGERPDGDMIALVAHVAELSQLADVDQDGRRGQAELHERAASEWPPASSLASSPWSESIVMASATEPARR